MHFREFVEVTVEYPGATLLHGMEHGTLYYGVSSAFLAGLVNFTQPVAGVLFERYDVLDRAKAQIIIDRRVRDHVGHPSLGDFEDDVMLLCNPDSEASGDLSEYYLFWFDREVSNCAVGWFTATDPPETVLAEFHEWVESLCDRREQGVMRKFSNGHNWFDCISDWMPLPVEYLRGGGVTFE